MLLNSSVILKTVKNRQQSSIIANCLSGNGNVGRTLSKNLEYFESRNHERRRRDFRSEEDRRGEREFVRAHRKVHPKLRNQKQ